MKNLLRFYLCDVASWLVHELPGFRVFPLAVAIDAGLSGSYSIVKLERATHVAEYLFLARVA